MRSRTSTSRRRTRQPATATPDGGGSDGRPPRSLGASPRLADGIELIGKYEGSGFKDEPYIARRADGQVVQLPELLYLVAEEADGRTDCATIAERVSARFGRGLEGEDVQLLVEKKLRPLGVLASADGSSPKLEKADPMLALRFRVAVIPPGAVRAITDLFKFLFLPAIVLAVIAGLVAADWWLFFSHGVAGSVRQIVYNPVLVVIVLGLLTLSAAFHEIGHATACRYGGAEPGAMGAGIYVVWPAFYTDVTDAYRLDRRGRLRTDLGGIYFNAIFILATVAVYFATGYEPLLLLVPVQHFQMLFQLLPLLRLDGYYVISDLTGVPDMLGRIKPILRSFVPGRETEPSVSALKPWARAVVTIYVLITVPALLLGFTLVLLNVPRIAATGYDSFFLQLDRIRDSSSDLSVAVGSVQLVILVLPALGMTLTMGRAARAVGWGVWAATETRPLLRTAFMGGAGALAAFLAFTWWPNGEYRPIQAGERGTIQGGIRQLAAVPTGRPSLTPTRRHELGNAPTRHGRGKLRGQGNDSSVPTAGNPSSPGPDTSPQTGTSPQTTLPVTPQGAPTDTSVSETHAPATTDETGTFTTDTLTTDTLTTDTPTSETTTSDTNTTETATTETATTETTTTETTTETTTTETTTTDTTLTP
jgi:putative peptide zinc metalloprotease protein